MRRRRSRFVAVVAIMLAVLLAAALGLLYVGGSRETVDSLIKKGQESGSRGDYQKAIDYLREALKLDPGSYPALLLLGSALLTQGDRKEAVVYLRKALEVNPNSAEKAQIEQMIQEASR